MWARAVKEHDTNVTVTSQQQILPDQIEVRYGLTAQPKKKILSTTDVSKLRKALKKFAAASSRQEVLKSLD